MIIIDVKTKAVSGWDRRNPMARNKFGDATPGYVRGHIKPNFPVPAIRQPGFITQLWIAPKSRYKQRKVNKWFCALCFDENNTYID